MLLNESYFRIYLTSPNMYYLEEEKWLIPFTSQNIFIFHKIICLICPISVTFFFLCSLTLPTTKYSIIVFLNIWLNKYYITKRKFNSSCSCILGLIILYFNLLINIENITNWLVYFIFWSCFIYFYLINQIRLRPLQM